MAEQSATGRTVLIAGAANIFVGAIKLVAGILVGSSAMLAEAAHSRPGRFGKPDDQGVFAQHMRLNGATHAGASVPKIAAKTRPRRHGEALGPARPGQSSLLLYRRTSRLAVSHKGAERRGLEDIAQPLTAADAPPRLVRYGPPPREVRAAR